MREWTITSEGSYILNSPLVSTLPAERAILQDLQDYGSASTERLLEALEGEFEPGTIRSNLNYLHNKGYIQVT